MGPLTNLIWAGLVGVGFIPWLSSWPAQFVDALTTSLIVVYIIFYRLLFPRWLERWEIMVIRVDVIVSGVVILLFINNSGGIDSPYFFLYYFLAIGIALLHGVKVSAIWVVSILAFYTYQVFTKTIATALDIYLIRAFSLLLTLPFTAFFAASYLKLKEQKQQIHVLFTEKQQFVTAHQMLGKIQQDVIAWTVFKLKENLTIVRNYLFVILTADRANLSHDQELGLRRSYNSTAQGIETLKIFEQKMHLRQSDPSKTDSADDLIHQFEEL